MSEILLRERVPIKGSLPFVENWSPSEWTTTVKCSMKSEREGINALAKPSGTGCVEMLGDWELVVASSQRKLGIGNISALALEDKVHLQVADRCLPGKGRAGLSKSTAPNRCP
jgi:hypothetical protein